MKNLFFIAVILFGVGCAKKSVPAAVPLGYAYYPTGMGKFVEYDVDSVVYTEIPRDTLAYKYRVKEKIADSFTDNLGQPAIRLERYIKIFNPAVPYDSTAWRIKEVWAVNATSRSIQVVEANVRYTKLIFPVAQKSAWNGNAANTIGEWPYIYDYVDNPETINGHVFEKVLLVNQLSETSALSHRRFVEKYAEGVGLVYREMTEVFSDNPVANVPVESRIEKGMIYKQTLVNFGYE